MQTNFDTPTATVSAGFLKRPQLAAELSKTERTIIRWEHAGLPVIRVGMTRLYDPAAVREWLLTHQHRHETPKRGRPTNKRTA